VSGTISNNKLDNILKPLLDNGRLTKKNWGIILKGMNNYYIRKDKNNTNLKSNNGNNRL